MVNDAVFDYVEEAGSRIVAKSGIETDKYHFGKLIIQSLEETPDFVVQINGATGESETNRSTLERTIRCAIGLQKQSLKKGDVLVLMGPNHLDMCIPFYASLYLGLAVASVDETLGVTELQHTFNIRRPKIIFCQSEKVESIEKALSLCEVESIIVTFNNGSKHGNFGDLINDVDDKAVKEFQPSNFDASETPALLIATSGTTGLPKAAVLTHKNLCVSSLTFWSNYTKFPFPTKMTLVLSPVQWLGAISNYLFTPILKITRLQTSLPITPDHFVHLVNTYKPTYTMTSPVLLNNLSTLNDRCDFSYFETIILAGSTVSQDLVNKFRKLTKGNQVFGLYGLSEMSGPTFRDDYETSSQGYYCITKDSQCRLVDPSTGLDVTETNVFGEIWFKGPQVFKGYYNSPKLTADILTEDGWLKSGDKFFKNEHGNFVFVERYKTLLKYKSHQISPSEVEDVIKRHPGVSDVCIVGIPDEECGDLVVACIIPKSGSVVKAQEIKDLVKDSLADSKQLRGGVTFWTEWPMTSNCKINRVTIQQIVKTMERE